jgi:superfamily II RNA helicase
MEAPLEARLPAPGAAEPDEVMGWFLGHVASIGLELYPAQEEAILELYTGSNVILATPTGSGKSLVALAAHFGAMAAGKRSFYTCPIRALANEKFFALCKEFGAHNVGLLTGDAAVNRDAPIICCTAEILANIALREGRDAAVDLVVMDEFHYYADKDRGTAWQVPLLILDRAQFLLMSATLGDTAVFEERLTKLTGRTTRTVASTHRPVPLDFSYAETPLHETVMELLRKSKAPIYVVCFTQRGAAETAQDLMSLDVCSKDDKKAIATSLESFRWASPYGKDLQRFVRQGIGIHHAGLLPRYRRLIERLAQEGKLKVICGTDTLGVGVNVPIRTVLLTQLCKYDGNKTVILSARDFHQISGRAGRKGFDVAGSVVAQAPGHVIENQRMEQRASGDKAKMRKIVKRKPPERGYVHWDKATFERLIASRPEPLVSRFSMSHGMLLNVLARPEGGCMAMARIVKAAHEPLVRRRQIGRTARQMYQSLLDTGIVGLEEGRLRVHADLQEDFSMHHALSLWLVETVGLLDKESPEYALDVLTLVEAVLEDPEVVLFRQLDKLKGQKIAELKAAGVEYEERMAELDKVQPPRPRADFIEATFREFATRHPWVGDHIRPKSVAREMLESLSSFSSFIKEYDLRRSEGVLLRYLSDVYKTLVQSVPEPDKTEGVRDVELFFRAIVRQVDASLLDEWEAMRSGAAVRPREEAEEPEIVFDERAFAILVRNECFDLVRALAARDFVAAAELAGAPWTPLEIERTMKPYFDEHGVVRTDPIARGNRFYAVERGDLAWKVRQTLVEPTPSGGPDAPDADAPEPSGEWSFEAKVDLARSRTEGRPVLAVVRLGA